MLRQYLKAIRNVSIAGVIITCIVALAQFPYDTDAPLSRQKIEKLQKYYADAYRKPKKELQNRSEYETRYIQIAQKAAKAFKIEEQVREFVAQNELTDKAVLEIGSGRGYLQDIVENYTGLDISPTVERFYHKKFVLGSATAMPFPDSSFDAIWSIWVFEHVPNPEQAFREARRVTKDQGIFFLYPAWNTPSWAADGYAVRPYSDFRIVEKLKKASIPVRSSPWFRFVSLVPTRILRSFVAAWGPTKLRYRRLNPNYDVYWTDDSDAVNSIDIHEAMLWFVSRGDKCLNCYKWPILMTDVNQSLIIRVNKQQELK